MEVILRHDEAEYKLLAFFQNGSKGAFPIGTLSPGFMQEAFERCIDKDYFSLIDLTPLNIDPPGVLWRIYKLTAAGRARRDALAIVYNPGGAEANGNKPGFQLLDGGSHD